MSKEKKINMPSSGGGLTQYFDDSESKIQMNPKVVVGGVIIIAIITILLNSL